MAERQPSKSLSYYLILLLGKWGRKAMVHAVASRRHNSRRVTIPSDFSTAGTILLILPEKTMDALYQYGTIVSIMNHFPEKRIYLLCEKTIGPYFSIISGIRKIFTYAKAERYLYSRAFSILIKEINRTSADLCICLDRNPDLVLLNLVAHLDAPIRVSYSEAGSFPFFNIRVQAPLHDGSIFHHNEAINRIMGVPENGVLPQRSISAKYIEEIAVHLQDTRPTPLTPIGGIDAQYIYHACGQQWADRFIERLNGQKNITPYLFSNVIDDTVPDADFLSWIQGKKVPIFSQLNPSIMAALICESAYIITGNTPAFLMANLFQVPAVGLFRENEITRYFQKAPTNHGYALPADPDESIMEKVCRTVSTLARTP